MSRTDEFLDLYKQLEQEAIETYGFPSDGRAVSELERLRQYDDVKREIKYCREVRNLLSHNEKIDSQYSVEPSQAMIELLRDTIVRVQNPSRCYEFATKPPNIMTAHIGDLALPLMRKMKERGFSHVPVVEGGVLRSVFSASTPFSYMLTHGFIEISEETTLRYFKDFLPPKMHATESFHFLGRHTLISDAETLFMDSLKQSRRIGMIFITEHGRPHEKLLGVITPHDIVGR
ncbi:MAG: hypothetical protein ACOX8S_00215 [Christensenellales bacterium]|jgi:CBS domain-containing protein